MSRVFIIFGIFSLGAFAAPDFTLHCHDGSGHWHRFYVDVNHPISGVEFLGDGDTAPALKATTSISSREIDPHAPLEWTYTFNLLQTGPIQGSIVFVGSETERGSRIVEEGNATIQFKHEVYDYLNGQYGCSRLSIGCDHRNLFRHSR